MKIAECTLTVRPVEEQDYPQWLEYWQAYQDFYRVALSEATTATTWMRFFDPREPVHCAVISDGTRLYGFVHFLFHRSTWGTTDFCYLEDLYVAPEARGHQVGKRLIEHVQAEAREQHCARLYWHTQQSNSTAQRLYDWIAEKPGVIEYRMVI
ncbi:GNAT family N-acetyltransferase [Pseudomonas sp. SDI]|uniref:GNAT family N-acetyltransferase n=1 Tax=Pseudomonas sp. SDI TaxID=2170734 RepID=UPI000DE70D05|nr:GNAT family N-acetyltransferase [Pseudomonas sp. SDI]PWB35929.1 GNAT family N-acetyltransferase [Pseudomonas sp. SDI]